MENNISNNVVFYIKELGKADYTVKPIIELLNANVKILHSTWLNGKNDIIKSLDLRENRFGFEPEVTAKISKIEKIRIYEVGIAYYGRDYSDGKKINWKDGISAIWCIFRYNLFD